MVFSESAIWLKLMILNIVLQICLQIMFVSAQSRYSKVVLHYTLQQTADRWINVSLFLLACVDSLQLMNFYFMHRTRFFQRYLLGGGGYNRPQYLFVYKNICIVYIENYICMYGIYFVGVCKNISTKSDWNLSRLKRIYACTRSHCWHWHDPNRA